MDCCKFEASLDYVLLGKPGLQSETLSQKQKSNKQKNKPKDDDFKKKKDNGEWEFENPPKF